MQETRQNRIARLLQKELADIFQRQTQQMHGVLVSVTAARVSPDLSICTAHLSIFPSERADELLKTFRPMRRVSAMSWDGVCTISSASFPSSASSLMTRSTTLSISMSC